MNKYSKGQTLVGKSGTKRKVLEVLGDLVWASQIDNFEHASGVYHYKEIDQNYTVEQEKEVLEYGDDCWVVNPVSAQKIFNSHFANDNTTKHWLSLNLVFKTKEEALARYNEIINLIK